MKKKTFNRVINLIGILIGATLAYFNPMFFQIYLPVIGIGLGLFYFFSTNSVNKNPAAKKVTDFQEYTWYSIYKLILGFLVGGAIVSTIILTIDAFEQQKNFSAILYLLPYV